MTKYPYKYHIITKDGVTVTDRMNKGKPLNAGSQRNAKRVLKSRYPGCIVMSVETKAKKHFDSNVGQFGSSIFL